MITLAEAAQQLPGASVRHLQPDAHQDRARPHFLYGPCAPETLHFFLANRYVPNVSVYTLRDICVDGPWFDLGALLSQDGTYFRCNEIALIPDSDVGQAQIAKTAAGLANGSRTRQKVSGPALLLATNGHMGFGHWLVDFLPKLYLCVQAGINLSDLKILLPRNMGGFGYEFLRLCGFADEMIVSYQPQHVVLDVEELVVPTGLRWGGRLADGFGEAAAFLSHLITSRNRLPEMSISGPIFIKRIAPVDHKPLHNRVELEQLCVHAGFTVVEPERLSVLEQITLYRRARHIFGEYGSSLHTAMFSRPGAVIGCVHQHPPITFDAIQSSVGERCNLITGYIFPDVVPGTPGATEPLTVVSPHELARCLDAFFTL